MVFPAEETHCYEINFLRRGLTDWKETGEKKNISLKR